MTAAVLVQGSVWERLRVRCAASRARIDIGQTFGANITKDQEPFALSHHLNRVAPPNNMTKADIAICWVSVHGGRYHALLHLRDRLRRQGIRCTVLLNCDAPLGLQLGVDLNPEQAAALVDDDIHIVSLSRMADALRETGARLCLFDAHAGPEVPLLIERVRRDMAAITVQTSSLLADYTCHGADYALVQHPISLWVALDYSREKTATRLAQAKAVFFSGNIFYEPLLNTWTSGLRTREQFQAKYALDPAKPTALWLPNREDGQDPDYGRIMERARAAGFNVVVKLHPWEYKQLRHGFDPYGQGMTSAKRWGARAMDECDSSWGLAFSDVGLMRGSSMGLELPFWRKPGIYLPYPGVHVPWYQLLLEMTRGVTEHLDSVDALEALLRDHWPLVYTDADYDRAKRFTMPRGAGGQGQPDSLDLHVRHLSAILQGRTDGAACTPAGSLSTLRRVFEAEIPPDFYHRLRLWRRFFHAARKFVGLRPKYRA